MHYIKIKIQCTKLHIEYHVDRPGIVFGESDENTLHDFAPKTGKNHDFYFKVRNLFCNMIT